MFQVRFIQYIYIGKKIEPRQRGKTLEYHNICIVRQDS